MQDRGATGLDIVRARRAGTGVVDAAPIAELVGPSMDVSPVVSADELVLYFGSNRGGQANKLDVWMASRQKVTDPFSTPVAVPELASALNDTPRWISPDLCTLYVSSRRSGNGGLYVARRSPP